MFSWEYVRCAALSAARNPGVVKSVLRGEDAGKAIHDRRMREWLRTRERYLREPKSTLGFRVFLNPEDMSQISSMIATSGWLSLPVTCLLMKTLGEGMNVVDVGANVGFYTLVAAKAVGERGRVWSFEPEPNNFSLLTRSALASNLRNVVPVRMALSDGSASKTLYLAPTSEPNAHTLTKDRGSGSLEVESRTLDEFWRATGMGRLHLLKVHVFGDEPLVLRGSREVLQAWRPIVVTRFGSSKWDDYRDLVDDLLSWYRVYETVESPSLIRPVARSALNTQVRRGIVLLPGKT